MPGIIHSTRSEGSVFLYHGSFNAAPPGDCIFFTLPHITIDGVKIVTDEKAPVQLMLRAKLLGDYDGAFTMNIGNDITATMTIGTGKNDEDSNEQATVCIPAAGTQKQNEDADYTKIIIRPDMNWLETCKDFHIFKIAIAIHQTGMHKKNYWPQYSGAGFLIGIQRPR